MPLVTRAVLPAGVPLEGDGGCFLAQIEVAQKKSNGEAMNLLFHRRHRLCCQRLRFVVGSVRRRFRLTRVAAAGLLFAESGRAQRGLAEERWTNR